MKLLPLLMAWAALAQDDFLPLKEGTRWTYRVEELAADASSRDRDVVTAVRGARAIGDADWVEVSDFLGYSSCFVRSTAGGVDLKLEPSDKAPALTLLKLPLREGDRWQGGFGKEEVTFATQAEERVELFDRVVRATRVHFQVSDAKKHEGHSPTHGDLWFAAGLGIVQAQVTRDLDCHSGTTTRFRLKN